MKLHFLLQKSIFELKLADIKTPELDARVLFEHAIDKDSSFVFSHPEHLITNSQYSRFRRYIRRRKKGEPVAYILGHKEFFGNDFFVNKNVLVPRPETEWLVEKALGFLQNYELRIKNQAKRKVVNILDMGTGSGCIIISLVNALLNSEFLILNSNFYASDISKKAIAIAKKNAKQNNVEKYVKFYTSDLFSNRFLNKKFDLIIANLPYVPCQARIQNSEFRIRQNRGIDFEPENAIFTENNGTAVIKKFLRQAKDHIAPNGLILIELDSHNATSIFKFAKDIYPTAQIKLKKDLAGLDRYIEIKNN